MKFKVSPQIFRDFPGTRIGVVIAHDIDTTSHNEKVKELLDSVQEKVRAELKAETLPAHPHIANWLEAYRKFGSNPKKYPPSVYNLAQRVLKGKLPSINSIVDIYNFVSLKYLLPAGGEDLATIKGDMELAIAGDNEPAVRLLGDSDDKKPDVGEVFYKDSVGAVCRRWNWKEADRTRLTNTTRNAIFVLEALPPVSTEAVESAMHELATLIKKYCGGTVSVALVDEQHPELELKKDAVYKHQLSPDQSLIKELNVFSLEDKQLEREYSNEFKIRVEKVEAMQKTGIKPWPAGKEVNATCAQVIDEYCPGCETHDKHTYAVAGRLVTFREHGKTAFGHIQDRTGRLQVYIKKDEIGEAAFNELTHYIDLGDIVWFAGYPFVTKTGETTLHATALSLLSKCLHPLPEKFHGLVDIETVYRQRYLDLISNTDSRNRFKKRSLIVRGIRNYLDSLDFLEVETPMLHPIPGGAAARPFVTHHNALDMELFMRIAPELYLKRLVVGGLERVYEINRNFRNEGISTRHNPEFTMLEFYMAYQDYNFAMDLVEEMIKKMALEVASGLRLPYGEKELDFGAPFTRMSMHDAVMQYAQCTAADLKGDAINDLVKKHGVHLANKNASWGEKLYGLFEKVVEPHLWEPTYITQFPVEVSPLAKRDQKDPSIAARFELFIGGMELSNGFNELNDPFDQAERFREQAGARTAGDAEAHHYDADYVQALEYALPPTVGVGIGIDRLVMLLTNTTSIKDVILFPTLKRKEA